MNQMADMTRSLSRQQIPKDFPRRIKRLRARLGLTQARLAELMGVSFATVNRWENGQVRPSALAWRQILRAEEEGIEGLEKSRALSLPPPESSAPPTLELEPPPKIDFSTDPEIVHAVAEGERLSYGHLFSPAFATELSMIDPLPHQRIAVYDHMLTQPRLRFLLADDAGAGKTIMAGLYIREMVARRLVSRVLVVPPAGLIGNWEREMRTLFSLPFRIVTGSDMRAGNPFAGAEGRLVIVSVDTLSAPRAFSRLQEPSVEAYDLVIFDEAHKLSADRQPDFTVRRTDRYRLAEALAGVRGVDQRWTLNWACQHLILLTATPHMGKEYPYFALWRLLEPDVLTTPEAFHAFPPEARRWHFLRRTKEEMVRFDGSRIYPQRISDTLTYDLSEGDISEKKLYEWTTRYIENFYNLARILNRSAARFAMSIFQRRLASSTYALMRSFERRLDKLEKLMDDIRSGRITLEQLAAQQARLEVDDILESKTGEEEDAENGREENEIAEERALAGVVATSLAQLEAERDQVRGLLDLARQVYAKGDESKFEKLREVLQDPRFRDEKILLFTEHRDTLEFLVRRLEGLGFTGQVAQIHGGMDYKEREEQVEFFRRPSFEGGATYLVATDAAGEGINLQFCWLMINYDVPWNPARLEQRLGRLHRYKQLHDPVRVMNLVAAKTREGRVLKTLLDKLERIRAELGSDKVFDVVGRLFEGVSLKEYMELAVTERGADEACGRLEGKLTKEQILALQERERRLYGDGGDVQAHLPDQKARLAAEELRHLLPGYVRGFLERAAPLLDLAIEGDPDGVFTFWGLRPGAMDPFYPSLDWYRDERWNRFTVYKYKESEDAIFLRPGEPFFERLKDALRSRYGLAALRGAAFVDPYADRPYILHLAEASVVRKADPRFSPFVREEILESWIVGLKNDDGGRIEEFPIERLLLLKGSKGIPIECLPLAAAANESRDLASAFAVENVTAPLALKWREDLLKNLPAREEFLVRGYQYQEVELADARARLADKARQGDARAQAEIAKIRERQRGLETRREETVAQLRREPELIVPGELRFLAHALVIPSSSEEDRKRHDAAVEALAVKVAWAHEEAAGASVRDVSTPEKARAAGLTDHPGFDLLSRRPEAEERPIEVKGRAGVGDIELTDNEWSKACNLRDRYWLYVVFYCASPVPRLLRIRDPFGKLLAKAKGGVVIDERSILAAAEREQ